MAVPKPKIPPQTMSNWQRIVDLIARLADVPASLVMQTHAPDHSVLVTSHSPGNPYDVGRRFTLNDKLYCFGVLKNDGELVVEDATCEPAWVDNEDMEHGMSFYVGFPLKWPDGVIFGTICVLDKHRNRRALMFREGLQEFARVIEADLRLLTEIDQRARLEAKLQATLDQLERNVAKRTSELEEANTALRVLLANVEQSRNEYDAKVLRQIKGLVLPHLGKLRSRLEGDSAASAYLEMIDENLRSITASMSDQFSEVFEVLTPSEQEVAQMIMHGQTTKDIARTLSREPSTVEFHRNNIRKKLGLKRSGKNLRSLLLSIQ
ncbi:LuxR C-terminal-related transcriptional regulator [Roseobacter sp. EG26]|uniref:LuxR C-terminal-related transcriptional regulator n=1 Tax=Roseobacter sp. EG26 TaxID=3412477 RepID=UPI00263757D1|nr:LuxR C-terminal-related transcriptional regulator [uncultured Roseobacter sp.]